MKVCKSKGNRGLNIAVNENKKTVVAFLDNLDSELDEMFYKYGLYDGTHDSYPLIKDRIVGKAVCADGDNFDVEVGKKIARTKFRKKYKAEVRKAIDKLIEDEYKYIGKLKNFKYKFRQKDEDEILAKY